MLSRAEYAKEFHANLRKHKLENINHQFKVAMNAKAHQTAQILMGFLENAWGRKMGSLHDLKLQFDWSPRRTTSYGGPFRINIGMVTATIPYSFREYSSYNNDAQIGFLETNNSTKHLAAILAHELAHSAQYRIIKTYRLHPELFGHEEEKLIKTNKPHGALFRKIYRALRVNYVNLLPEII